MKRVSFKVAKAIKEGGYPQGVLPQIHKEKSFPMYYNGDFVPDYDYFYANYITTSDPNLCIVCPTYLDVWLWLWEKGICIEIKNNHYYTLAKVNNERFHGDTPEESISEAIEYLCDNNLIR